ncbi:hypothetical protein NEF87_002167 [Candidatus Lokiarchaeum ossiferum]|uniref:Acyltransferase 3 domain-containing protein n=1 Tax=Candidatus Lokiarchaeum ossiferum TaxID=2951803 RepID=A0ABY6HSP6_9ARCH|nr:hypothetical protein NEF87_002167 [Candidatus Lokiarchaeum sp. B-35]
MDTEYDQTATLEELQVESSQRKRYFQVDAMKAIMIGLVIMDHTFTHSFLHQFGSPFWERISIPILMIIMGFNLGNSSKGINHMKLKDYYTRSYFEKKLKRYFIPYLILYFIHGIMRLIVTLGEIQINSPATYDSAVFRYLGFTLFYGPGLWFIPVLFGTILVFPILHFYFKKMPSTTFFATFCIEFLTQFIVLMILSTNQGNILGVFYFLYSVFCLFSAIGMGLWLSIDHNMSSKHNVVIWILFPISLGYMIIAMIFPGLLFFPIGDYQMFYFPYSAVIFMCCMKLIPENPKGTVSEFIRKVSKSTYHILLAQIFYFSIVFQFFLIMTDGDASTLDIFDAAPLNYLWFFPLNLVITFGIGLFWNHLEEKFYKKMPEKRGYQKIYAFMLTLAVIAFAAWIIGQILFFFVVF